MNAAAKKVVFRVDAVGVLVTAAVCLGILYVGAQPVVESKRKASELRDEVATTQGEAAALMGRASALTERVASLRRALDANAVPLKPSGSVNAQIARLTTLASGSALTIDEIRPGRATELTDHIERPLALSGAGDFAALVGFLTQLETDFPDLRVRAMNLTGDAKSPGTARFEMELTWFADPAGAQAPAQRPGP